MLHLFLRLFVEAASEEEARALAFRLRNVLAALSGTVEIDTVRPYWKIPEYQEVTLRIEVRGELAGIFSSVLGVLGAGWVEQQADREAIWDSKVASAFVEPAVRWAHLEVIE